MNELGIQYYALERYDRALIFFAEAREIYQLNGGNYHSNAWIVLNNMACVHYSMKQMDNAFDIFSAMSEIQKQVHSTVPLDILHLATSFCNLGYLCVQLKMYDTVSHRYLAYATNNR